MTRNLSELEYKTSELYETDFYAWTVEQAKFLRNGDWGNLDIPNLKETFSQECPYSLEQILDFEFFPGE